MASRDSAPSPNYQPRSDTKTPGYSGLVRNGGHGRGVREDGQDVKGDRKAHAGIRQRDVATRLRSVLWSGALAPSWVDMPRGGVGSERVGSAKKQKPAVSPSSAPVSRRRKRNPCQRPSSRELTRTCQAGNPMCVRHGIPPRAGWRVCVSWGAGDLPCFTAHGLSSRRPRDSGCRG